MITIKRTKYYAIVQGTEEEMRRLDGLAGAEVNPGDKLTVLPYKHHVHRNPGYPALIKIIEDKEAGK